MPTATARALARQEREEFADFLATLPPQQWSTESLCPRWTVRDVVAHTITYLDQSRKRLLVNMIRHRGDIDRLNADLLDSSTALLPEQLVRLMRRGAEPSGAGALYWGRVR